RPFPSSIEPGLEHQSQIAGRERGGHRGTAEEIGRDRAVEHLIEREVAGAERAGRDDVDTGPAGYRTGAAVGPGHRIPADDLLRRGDRLEESVGVKEGRGADADRTGWRRR